MTTTIPTIDDQRNAYHSNLYQDMRRMHFKPPKWYGWSKDPLKHWSRIWEYPWVYSHLKPGSVLDAGAGITHFPSYLMANGHKVTVLDSNWHYVQYMRLRYPGMDGVHGTLETHKGQYDNVICISVIEHMDDPDKAFENLKKCVKPGGRLIATFDVPAQKVNGSYHKLWFPFTEYPDVTGKDILNSRNAPLGQKPGPTHILKRIASKVKRGHPFGHIPLIAVCGVVWDNVD